MPHVAEDRPANVPLPNALPATELVSLIAQAMRTIAQLYATSLNDPRVDANMLLGLLALGQGASRSDVEASLSLGIEDPAAVLDQLLTAGLIDAEQGQTLRPTPATRQLFRRLFEVAQVENARWRQALAGLPAGTLVLDEFFTMLQTSHHA